MMMRPRQGIGANAYRLETSMGFLVNRASRDIRRVWNAELRRRGYPISGEHFAVLVHVWKSGRIGSAAIAAILQKDRPAVSRLLFDLEARGYLARARCPGDGRRSDLGLTRSGTVLMKTLTALASGVLAAAQAGISARDLEVCRSVLDHIHANLACAASGRPDSTAATLAARGARREAKKGARR